MNLAADPADNLTCYWVCHPCPHAIKLEKLLGHSQLVLNYSACLTPPKAVPEPAPSQPCICTDKRMHAYLLSHGRLFATFWTVARQAPLSVEFSRQRSWSGLPFPPLADLLDSGIKSASPISPALVDRVFTTESSGKAPPTTLF